MDLTAILFFIAGVVLIFVVGSLLVVPLKLLVRLALNGVVGGLFLLLFNFIGGIFNLNLPITPLNAIIVGFLGVPGVILLLLIQLLL